MRQDALQHADLDDMSHDELKALVIAAREADGDKFRLEQFDYVLEQLLNGRSARSVFLHEQEGDKEKAPGSSTFYWWLSDTRLDTLYKLTERYRRIQDIRLLQDYEYMDEIVDDARNDFIEKLREDGSTEVLFDKENIARSRLRWDHRRWKQARSDRKNEKQGEGGAVVETKIIEYYPDPKGESDG